MQPETILEKLVRDLTNRQATLRADRNVHTFYLKEFDPNELIQLSYTHVLKGLQRKGTLTEIIVAVGRSIRQEHKLPLDSILDAHAGWFVLVSFIEMRIVNFIKSSLVRNGKTSKNTTYQIEPKDWKAIKTLWTLIDKTKIQAYPFKAPPPDWIAATHDSGHPMIKKGHPTALKQLHPNSQPICFDVINKLQKIGWAINNETFAVYQQCMRLEGLPSPFKHVKEIDRQKRNSLIMEMEAIEQIALTFINAPFYHLYNYDFR